jgi:uncharacterized membrane protein YfcA
VSGWWIAVLAGAVTGILSGFGIGGGSLLLLYMTNWVGLSQSIAQGINLLYFLPTAATALPAHLRNGYLVRPALLPAIGAGLAGTALAAWWATALEVELLRTCFGGFLLLIGTRELLRRDRPDSSPEKDFR